MSMVGHMSVLKCTPIWDDLGCSGTRGEGVEAMGHRKAKCYPLMKVDEGGSRLATVVQREDEAMNIYSNPTGQGPRPSAASALFFKLGAKGWGRPAQHGATGSVGSPDVPLIRSLEPPHHAAGIAEVVLVVAGAGGKAGGQRVERVEIGADEIHLRRANGEMAGETDVDAAAKSHGECVGAIQGSRYSAHDRHTYACAQAGVRRAEQRVSKDGALAEISGDSGTKQEVVHVLLRAGRKAQKGNAGKLLGVAAEVGSDAEMAGEVEGALAFPSIEIVAAEVETAAPDIAADAAAEVIVGMKKGVSPVDGAACCYLAGLLLGKAQHGKTQNG
jgi:hypothetical protein